MKTFALMCLAAAVISSPCFAKTPDLGQKIYNQSCQTCHNENVAPMMKAPAVHQVDAWKARFDAAKAELKSSGTSGDAMNVLVKSVKAGKGSMPPGGMCNNCTDKELRAAIKYMSTKG